MFGSVSISPTSSSVPSRSRSSGKRIGALLQAKRVSRGSQPTSPSVNLPLPSFSKKFIQGFDRGDCLPIRSRSPSASRSKNAMRRGPCDVM
jgi:hypothetical protein